MNIKKEEAGLDDGPARRHPGGSAPTSALVDGRKRPFVRAIFCVALGCAAGAVSSCGLAEQKPPPVSLLEGHYLVWRASLPVTGREVRTPPIDGDPSAYKILVEGYVDAGRYGEKLDAEHRTDQAQAFRLDHDHLRFSPDGIRPTHQDRVHHQYVYELPSDGVEGERLGIRFEGLAYRFRISPGKLAEVSRNRMYVSLWRRGSPPLPRWMLWAGAAAFVLILAVASLLISRRVRRSGGG